MSMATFEQRRESVARHRFAHQISLQLIASQLTQDRKLLGRFNAFCHGVHIECTGEADDGLNQFPTRNILRQVHHETTVDLQCVDRQRRLGTTEPQYLPLEEAAQRELHPIPTVFTLFAPFTETSIVQAITEIFIRRRTIYRVAAIGILFFCSVGAYAVDALADSKDADT